MQIYDFTRKEYGEYDPVEGCGFVARTASLPTRRLCPEKLLFTEQGVTMPPCPELVYARNENDFDYGGLAFRIQVPGPGAYHLEVELAAASDAVRIAVDGMHPEQIAQDGYWDAAQLIPRVHKASLTENLWSFDYVCGRTFMELEVEPVTPDGKVTVRRFCVSPLTSESPRPLPTVYTLGDSTVKSYIYEENLMSGWGQIFDDLFDPEQVTVLNYAMGGRSLATLFREGRANDLLLNAAPGDYLLLQSGQNDEARGPLNGPETRYGRGNTEESFLERLENYFIPAAAAMGLHLILVTPMTRINGDGTTEENGVQFCGFARSGSIDCPGLLRRAASAHGLPLIDLYAEGNRYLESIGGGAAKAMFLSVEAGETAGKTNSGSYANGHPDNKCDGTHYKEALSKQFARIVAASLLRQSLIPERFLLPYVREAIRTGNDYLMFPEMCPDVQTGRNAYYRNQIEFLVKHHIMKKAEDGCFHPLELVTTGDFLDALCLAMKLPAFPMECQLTEAGRLLSPDLRLTWLEEDLASPTPLTRERMASLIYRVYLFCFPVTEEPADPDRPHYAKPPYMTDYNGSGIAFDAPNYDPNLTGQSAMYYPLVSWEQLTDTDQISPDCLLAAKECYRLGLMRSESGIARGKMVCGTLFEPRTIVTREKAAKELYFLQTLIHGILEETDKF